MKYTSPQRNYENIQHAEIRKSIDPKFCDIHDELTKAYKEQIPFRNYGILDKETFDKLHGLIPDLKIIAFHTANKAKKKNKQIKEDDYRYEKDANGKITIDKLTMAENKIKEYKKNGIELEI